MGTERHRRLLLGSSNPRKVEEWRQTLRHIAVELVDPRQLGLAVEVAEDGSSAEENARIKAREYFRASSVVTFSVDFALRIDGLAPAQQPGVHVRRLGSAGHAATDAGIIDYYRELLRGLGGQAAGEWTMGMALALGSDRLHSETLVHRSLFVATPSPVVVPSMALRSLQVNPATGRYLSEMTPAEHADRLRERSRRIVAFITRYLPGVA